MALFPDVQSMIGRTPVVRLDRFAAPSAAMLFGKCEFINPGGSIKDRIGFAMVEAAEKSGALRPGGTIIEATAGNTGMGLAMAASLRGYSLIAVLTTKASVEKLDLMRAFGARVVVCPYDAPPGHPDHFIETARRMAREVPGGWHADQFDNIANARVHEETTGPEIWSDMDGQVDVVVGGIGTGGTMAGIGACLRRHNRDVKLVLADPVGSLLGDAVRNGRPLSTHGYLVEGIGGDFVPGLARLDLVDDVVAVEDLHAITQAIRLFRTEGLFVGASAGAILYAARQYATRPDMAGRRILAILPDGGRSYLSTIYNPRWRAEHGVALGGDADSLDMAGARPQGSQTCM